MPKPLPWYRMYHEMIDDPKVQQLPDSLFKIWVNLLSLTRRNHDHLPPVSEMAWALRIEEGRMQKAIDLLVKRGLLEAEREGFIPHNWHARQFQSDNSTERVKQWRERRKLVKPPGKIGRPRKGENPETLHATLRNENPETLHVTPVENPVTLHATLPEYRVQNTDTDTDTEPEKKVATDRNALQVAPSGEVAYSLNFERWWSAYGKKGSKKVAHDQWKRQGCEKIAARLIGATAVYLGTRRVQEGYKRDAEGWLKDRMWENPTLGEENEAPPVAPTKDAQRVKSMIAEGDAFVRMAKQEQQGKAAENGRGVLSGPDGPARSRLRARVEPGQADDLLAETERRDR